MRSIPNLRIQSQTRITTASLNKRNDLDDTDYQGSILNAVMRHLSRYSGCDEYLAENVSSSDEMISRAIQSALHQLVLNQAVTALKNGADEMIDVLYEDTKDRE